MYWYPFNAREAGFLLLVFLCGAVFSRLQPYFIPASLIPYTYVFVLLFLFLAYFPLARPIDALRLARFLAMLVGGIYALWIVIKQVLIHQTFSETTVIILAGAFLCPLVAGWCYRLATGCGARC